ncbi:hypothetical protein [Hoylesella shahii]|uniref:hypothetical protein n=1 Tax=Hoylesella shahii TaxID=228603 RepID=UPI0028EDA1C3|nr:hypothetical protein [Hoylesella shahii]
METNNTTNYLRIEARSSKYCKQVIFPINKETEEYLKSLNPGNGDFNVIGNGLRISLSITDKGIEF